jgi:predicted transcriptional regulator
MKKLQITDFKVQQSIVLYKSEKSLMDIAKEMHIDRSVLQRFLVEVGELRSRGEVIRSAKSKSVIKDNCLDILTPEALYWIGFLYADGHIEKEPRKVITLTLGEVDIEHLNKFRMFFADSLLTIRNVTSEKNKAPGQINFDKNIIGLVLVLKKFTIV